MNWGKSYLLLIGDPGISLPSVRIVSLEQSYKHLGIPVGVNPTNHLQDFWDEMVEKFRKTVSSWRKYHLSLKGRCLVANSLLMSIPRYAVRFLDLPQGVKGELDREYYRMIWDGQTRGTISNIHACAPVAEGGCGAFNLQTIADASAVNTVVRSLRYPKLPWVRLLTEVSVDATGARSILRDAVTSPWLQWLGHRTRIRHPPETKGLYERWRRLNGAEFQEVLSGSAPHRRYMTSWIPTAGIIRLLEPPIAVQGRGDGGAPRCAPSGLEGPGSWGTFGTPSWVPRGSQKDYLPRNGGR